jgi:protein ImuB
MNMMDGRRYLALWFPWLPCERARRAAGLPDGDTRPFALIARSGNALRLVAVCPRTAQAGLLPGMALADARARYPDLVTRPHDPDADARELAQRARAMLGVTPLVAGDPPDGLVLDITGVAHLFGGEAPLVAAALARCGLTVHHALADHAEAARALARHRAGDVRALPVAALGLDAGANAGLRRAGLTTVGDLAARPLAGLAARFGPAAVTALRRLLGEEQAPLDPLVPVARLRFERRFAEPIAHQAAVMAALAAMLDEARLALEARALGGRRFRLSLWRSDGACRQLDVDTSRPTRDPALVLRLFDERIAELADPLDPGFGYDAIALAVPVTEPLGAAQPALDGQDADADGLADLIDRLSTRLGPDSLLRLAARDSHVPERAQAVVPATRRASPRLPAWDRPPRPLVLFDPPQPVDVVAGVPDGPPLRFRWRDRLHAVGLAEGPERIAPEWWRRPDGHLPGGEPTRDYYRVEDDRGARFWIFRHGLYDETGAPQWYLHGLFA